MLTTIQNYEIINFTPEGKELSLLANNNLLEILYKKYSFGFQDGGCLIFASLISSFVENSKIVSVGRRGNSDHFAVSMKSKYGNIYIDSDGVFTKDEIIFKQFQMELFALVPSYEHIIIEEYDLHEFNTLDIVFDESIISDMKKDYGSLLVKILKDLQG
ncbi:hypothetical protein CP985_13645 [Malaciobacter mytili LMG 24559]|uniref:Uncharacterized protein n=1 Tax=Malaciobacter mytili LMG 24559 TaxID=1032238 RepID=A0AAX2ACS9_9BACT|nr:hypothetical protein [Malaciobacter mytili]AXH16443.1 hypothetical protein AMYT_a0145 [Malaciobacter mytili LMG 24559]RXK12994.1 hypothetical protein CP985_13645 [Malaciobacter mytili LMG 24559]